MDIQLNKQEPPADLSQALSVAERLRQRLRASVVGRDAVIDLVIVALLADGHVLLEDYPGSGKTTLAKALGESIVDVGGGSRIHSMRRIQFTPDLLPSDVTGTTIFDPEERKFFFRPGPIFAHVLLADEINRTSPKVQSALLEAMAEKQTTVDNTTHMLDSLFFVIATQNPLDLAGTYPLPNAQLDRFLFKIRMTHIPKKDELDLLMRFDQVRHGAGDSLPRVSRDEIVKARSLILEGIRIDPAIKKALVGLADETRSSNLSLQGVSTRSLVLAMPALQAYALLQGRSYVSSEDLAFLAPYVFSHRLMMAPGAGQPEEMIKECMKAPLERLSRSTVSR
jgi:MoxR-like ATPase